VVPGVAACALVKDGIKKITPTREEVVYDAQISFANPTTRRGLGAQRAGVESSSRSPTSPP